VGPAENREEIWHFMNNFLEGDDAEEVPLGCGGYKLTVEMDGAQTTSNRQASRS
jgi:hypothetical protein